MSAGLRIAMIGQKGIPARYGGVETHVENISVRLAERGHDVSVFCRSRFEPGHDSIPPGYQLVDGKPVYRGVRLVYRPSVNTKHLDAATHAFLCAVESGLFHRFDIAHFHGIGPSAFVPVTRALGRRVVATVHALDWRQVKWKGIAKRILKDGESLAARRSHGVIAVSRILEAYLLERYGVRARYIPNGATLQRPRDTASLARHGLSAGGYVLSVGRIIPDRGLHFLIEAFTALDTPLKLVIVGSETPPTAYTERLQQLADDRVIFTGDLFGDALEDLYAHCRLYVLPSEVEGLPITVCEAMAHGRPVLLSDIPENAEVGGDAAAYFKSTDIRDLRESLQNLLNDEAALARLGALGLERVTATYNWDTITDQTEAFYREVVSR